MIHLFEHRFCIVDQVDMKFLVRIVTKLAVEQYFVLLKFFSNIIFCRLDK